VVDAVPFETAVAEDPPGLHAGEDVLDAGSEGRVSTQRRGPRTRGKLRGDARFDKARFNGIAVFNGAKIECDARFDEAEMTDAAMFDGVEIGGHALFGGAKISGHASFDRARIRGDARFRHAEIADLAAFEEVELGGEAYLPSSTACYGSWCASR
jgi:hypothetical protein